MITTNVCFLFKFDNPSIEFRLSLEGNKHVDVELSHRQSTATIPESHILYF